MNKNIFFTFQKLCLAKILISILLFTAVLLILIHDNLYKITALCCLFFAVYIFSNIVIYLLLKKLSVMLDDIEHLKNKSKNN
jgi:hypothetical protein